MIEPRYLTTTEPEKYAIGPCIFEGIKKRPKSSKEKKALLRQIQRIQNELDKLYDKVWSMK